jgi:hypothetical protein
MADVQSLEELYFKLQPWDTTLNWSILTGDDVTRCGCGSTHLHSDGYVYTKTNKYLRFKCVACGKKFRDPKSALSKEKRKSMKKVV